MGTLSDYATTELVDHVFKAAYAPVATLYLCLCTTTPTTTSTGTTIVETDYTNYVRKSFTVTSFNAASVRKIVQALDIEFAQAGGVSTSNITGYAICDAATVGNMLAFGSFNSPWNVESGNTPKIAAAEIEISVGASTNGFTDIAVHKMLDLMFRNIAWTSPNGTIHFGATTAVISDTSTMVSITEATGGGYAREPAPNTSYSAATAGVITNDITAITFDTPTGDWSTGSNITSLFIVNDLSGTAGDLLAFDNTNVVDQPVAVGDTVQVAINAFDCDLD